MLRTAEGADGSRSDSNPRPIHYEQVVQPWVSRRPHRDSRLDSPSVIWDFLVPSELDVLSSLPEASAQLALHWLICVQQLSNARDRSIACADRVRKSSAHRAFCRAGHLRTSIGTADRVTRGRSPVRGGGPVSGLTAGGSGESSTRYAVEAVQQTKEVVPMNESTWVLLVGVTVGR